MTRLLVAVTVTVVLMGCTNKGLLPPLVPGNPTAQVHGTSQKDLWRFWSVTPANAGQDTPRDAFLQHHDGTSLVDVPVPALFDEASCGVPSSVAALTPGKVWLASQWVPQCGLGGPTVQSFQRILLGTVARDGTWVDRSADLPTVTSPAAYMSVELTQGAGLLFLRVRARDALGRESFRWFRLTEQATTELTGSVDAVLIVDAAHVFGTVNGSLTHRLDGDAFTELPSPALLPAGVLRRGGPEAWLWNASDVLQQPGNRVAHRFDGTAFIPIEFQVDAPEVSGSTWQAVGAVPRGNGKLTLLGARQVPTGVYASTDLAFTARQLVGDQLGSEVVVYGPLACNGSNQSGSECLRAQSRHEKTLDDGTIILRGASGGMVGPEASMIPASELP